VVKPSIEAGRQYSEKKDRQKKEGLRQLVKNKSKLTTTKRGEKEREELLKADKIFSWRWRWSRSDAPDLVNKRRKWKKTGLSK